MMGIDPSTQRRRMDESLGLILRLWTETEPITYESDWFTLREARVHLRPYSQPHMPVAVAPSQSPAGMISAGKYGIAVLSLNTVRLPGAIAPTWPNSGKSPRRPPPRTTDRQPRGLGLVIHVHLAESRKEAIEQARHGSGRYQRQYFENTLGLFQGSDVPEDRVIDEMVETTAGVWALPMT